MKTFVVQEPGYTSSAGVSFPNDYLDFFQHRDDRITSWIWCEPFTNHTFQRPKSEPQAYPYQLPDFGDHLSGPGEMDHRHLTLMMHSLEKANMLKCKTF